MLVYEHHIDLLVYDKKRRNSICNHSDNSLPDTFEVGEIKLASCSKEDINHVEKVTSLFHEVLANRNAIGVTVVVVACKVNSFR